MTAWKRYLTNKIRSIDSTFKPSMDQEWSDATDEVAMRDAKGRTFYEFVCYLQKMADDGKLDEADEWNPVNR